MERTLDLIDIINEQRNKFYSGESISTDLDLWNEYDENPLEDLSYKRRVFNPDIYGLRIVTLTTY
ncbi:MAG: hypothetical protein WAQ98_25655 [Blastocatellia bacterium]